MRLLRKGGACDEKEHICGCPFLRDLRQSSSGTYERSLDILVDREGIFELFVFRVQRERQTWGLRNPSGKDIGSERIEVLVTVQSSLRTCGCALSDLVDTGAMFVYFV